MLEITTGDVVNCHGHQVHGEDQCSGYWNPLKTEEKNNNRKHTRTDANWLLLSFQHSHTFETLTPTMCTPFVYISNAWNCWLCSVNRIKVFLIGKHVNDAKINIWCVHFSDDTFAFKICLKHEWLYTYSQQQREKWYGKIVISHKISFYGIHKWKYWHSFSPPKLK